MSQYPSGGYQETYADPMAQQPQRMSGLAIASFICGVLLCCPFLTSLLAVILGGSALVSIGNNPFRRGKGLAIIGLLLGLFGLVGWGLLTGWAAKKGEELLAVAQTSTPAALTAASAGDLARFKSEFWGAGANASDEEVQAFIDELENRYGTFKSGRVNQTSQTGQTVGEPIVPFGYTFEFANQTVDGKIGVTIFDQVQTQFVTKLAWITIHDPQRGDLTFPRSASGGGGASTRPAATMPSQNMP